MRGGKCHQCTENEALRLSLRLQLPRSKSEYIDDNESSNGARQVVAQVFFGKERWVYVASTARGDKENEKEQPEVQDNAVIESDARHEKECQRPKSVRQAQEVVDQEVDQPCEMNQFLQSGSQRQDGSDNAKPTQNFVLGATPHP